MEIERKYLFKEGSFNYSSYPYHEIEQAYLCTDPVIRIRRQDDSYILTYKGKGSMVREEHEFPLTEEAYAHLRKKIDGHIIKKRRYLIPLQDGLKAELDVFEGRLEGLMIVEVEFPSADMAADYRRPSWFGSDVTFDHEYHNSYLSTL
ncbi:MAG: CYTH domain-containing protein [Lachnospiraceae bacterium]|nr:CYTH domain-containing protein [Lachnospiraceae bacterium]